MVPSAEVDSAAGEAPARVNAVALLNEKRAALNAARDRYASAKAMRDETAMASESHLVDALRELIPELEKDAQVVLEAEGLAAATERLKRIKSAYGSTVSNYQQDEARVATATAALSDAIATLNSRVRKLEDLRAEARALADRFELTAPSLSLVSEPQQGVTLPPFWRHHQVRPISERCEHDLRERRDYTEIGGTPGYSIITTAGLKPFRQLSAQERDFLEDKAEVQLPDQVLARAVVEANALGNLGLPGARVQRG